MRIPCWPLLAAAPPPLLPCRLESGHGCSSGCGNLPACSPDWSADVRPPRRDSGPGGCDLRLFLERNEDSSLAGSALFRHVCGFRQAGAEARLSAAEKASEPSASPARLRDSRKEVAAAAE